MTAPAPRLVVLHTGPPADLLSGAPLSSTPAGSRRHIAVMQAATASAADGGRQVPVLA